MNRSTRRQWEMYASHRQQIERLIVPAQRGGRACVLGAGNCNDLDLRWMSEVFAEVHLVDLDAAALCDGVRRQGCEGSTKVVQHAAVDLTGVADLVAKWATQPPKDRDTDRCLQALRAPLKSFSSEGTGNHTPFDLVLSPCVLSQLLVSVRDVIGGDHPRYPEMRSAMIARHLRMICGLLAPGGSGVLAIDVASTENFAGLARVEEDRVPDLMRTLVADGKCFSALTPAAIRAAISRELESARLVGNVRVMRPWLWHLGLRKAFVVYGIKFTRQST